MSSPRLWTLAALVTGLALTGCAGTAASDASSAEAASDTAQPISLDNCGSTVEVDGPAERIVLVNNDALADIEALGAADRIVAITAPVQPDLYDDATVETLSDLTTLSTETNPTGGSIVSQESILGAEPDLVIAPENAVGRDALAAVGIAVYSPTAYCADPPAELSRTATFDRVWSEIANYGALLGESEKADAVIVEAQQRIDGTDTDRGTAAALYVSSGGSVLSPYGGPSMVTPVFAAAGLTNVYADSDQRVFDVNVEDLLSRDPATIVLLHSGDTAEQTLSSFLSTPGVDALQAVRTDRVVTLPFPYTDPPSVLSTEGPEQLTQIVDQLP